jgi:hypothetical protein
MTTAPPPARQRLDPRRRAAALELHHHRGHERFGWRIIFDQWHLGKTMCRGEILTQAVVFQARKGTRPCMASQ